MQGEGAAYQAVLDSIEALGVDYIGAPRPVEPLTQHIFKWRLGSHSHTVIQPLLSFPPRPSDCYLMHWPGKSGLRPEDPTNREVRHQSYRDLQRACQEGAWPCCVCVCSGLMWVCCSVLLYADEQVGRQQ